MLNGIGNAQANDGPKPHIGKFVTLAAQCKRGLRVPSFHLRANCANNNLSVFCVGGTLPHYFLCRFEFIGILQFKGIVGFVQVEEFVGVVGGFVRVEFFRQFTVVLHNHHGLLRNFLFPQPQNFVRVVWRRRPTWKGIAQVERDGGHQVVKQNSNDCREQQVKNAGGDWASAFLLPLLAAPSSPLRGARTGGFLSF